MSFEGLSPELMLCVRIRRERLWCSRPASKRSRQVLRRLVDQTAWDPNLGSRRVLRPILPRTEVSERQPPFRQDARTQIDRPSRDVRTHRAKENTCDNHFALPGALSVLNSNLFSVGLKIGTGGKGNLLLPRARASEKPDTNQTHLNRKDHTSYGPTGGNQTTTRTLSRGEGHPQPGPTTTSHHN